MSRLAYDSDFYGEGGEYLTELARDAVLAYQGNWQELVALQHRLRSGWQLNARESRQAVNMVLAVTSMWEWHHLIREALSPVAAQRSLPVKKSAKLKVVPDRKFALDWPVKVKVDYAKPKSKQGVVHIIDHDATIGRWSLQSKGRGFRYDWDAPRVFTLYGHWYCGKGSKDPILYAEPPGIRRCARCLEVEEERG